MSKHDLPQKDSYLDDPFSSKDIRLDFGQEHEAEVQCGVRLGSVQLELFHRTTQKSLHAIVIPFRFRGFDLIQKQRRRNCDTQTINSSSRTAKHTFRAANIQYFSSQPAAINIEEKVVRPSTIDSFLLLTWFNTCSLWTKHIHCLVSHWK